jgi:hypothetical protein
MTSFFVELVGNCHCSLPFSSHTYCIEHTSCMFLCHARFQADHSAVCFNAVQNGETTFFSMLKQQCPQKSATIRARSYKQWAAWGIFCVSMNEGELLDAPAVLSSCQNIAILLTLKVLDFSWRMGDSNN